MNVIPLGTNGFFPSFGRETMCFAIPYGKTLIILDAGTGLYRLAEPMGKRLLAGAENIHLYLSHYHLDHTFGFYGAWKILKDKKVTVFGKEEKKVFNDLAGDYFPINHEKEFGNFSWRKLDVGENKIGDYQVAVRRQYHNGAGSLAFKFSFGLAYVTDSEPTQESVEFVRDVPLLLHEHYLSGEEILDNTNAKLEDHFLGKHTTSIGAAMIAKEAKAGKLCLLHHYPFYNAKQLVKQREFARKIFEETELSIDLKHINF
ncbi:hypothetical protein HY338_03770 [Candidatus Gottesmanbacteria bacterium]|nr:hypothetical protein [Candidatus Gottesmanbacteria bacterium]